jgi:hypothetical protein
MSERDSNQQEGAGPRETGAAGASAPPAANPQNARKGKIARLPLAVRTELNQRLRDGEAGVDLLRWLNGLPEVKQVMRDHFAGAQLSEVNLSRWRDGGYEEWLAEERTREAAVALANRAAALKEVSVKSLTESMALVMVGRLAVELRRIESMENDEARFKCLRDIMWGIIYLRREEAECERLKREQARKAGLLLPEKELEKQFFLWAADPDNKELVRRRLFMTKEQREAAIDELLADDAHCWLADEEYIKSIGGKLGATLPEEFLKEMRGEKPEEPEKKPCPARLPEPPNPTGPLR